MAARCHMLVWYINGFHINLLVDKQTEKYKQFNLIAEDTENTSGTILV